MPEIVQHLSAIIALIHSIIQNEHYETADEVRAAIEKAIKDCGFTSLVAQFETAFKGRYFGGGAFTQTQALQAASEAVQVDAKYLFAAQTFVILAGHEIDSAILEILGISLEDDDDNHPTPKPPWMRGHGPKHQP
jgi:hypothetical protein